MIADIPPVLINPAIVVFTVLYGWLIIQVWSIARSGTQADRFTDIEACASAGHPYDRDMIAVHPDMAVGVCFCGAEIYPAGGDDMGPLSEPPVEQNKPAITPIEQDEP